MTATDMQARQLMARGVGQLSAMRLARERKTEAALELLDAGSTPFEVFQKLILPNSGKRR